MRVAFVGTNPSTAKSKTTSGLVMTHARLWEWLEAMRLDGPVCFHNVCDHSTEGNRPLKASEIEYDRLKRELVGYDAIIALGRTASKALDIIKVKHHSMPHPSPRNRLLNCKRAVDLYLDTLSLYLEVSRERAQDQKNHPEMQTTIGGTL